MAKLNLKFLRLTLVSPENQVVTELQAASATKLKPNNESKIAKENSFSLCAQILVLLSQQKSQKQTFKNLKNVAAASVFFSFPRHHQNFRHENCFFKIYVASSLVTFWGTTGCRLQGYDHICLSEFQCGMIWTG